MQELLKNDHYKIIRVELPAGKNMPTHFVTSDAFIIVESGSALLIYKDERTELISGSNFTIPSNQPHLLRVIDDFKAFIVLANDALITYAAS